MLRSHIPQPVAKPAPFTEAQAHAADMAYHRAKVDDPFRQRQADKTALTEMQLRAATGMVA